MIRRRKLVGYELFVPFMAAIAREKEKSDNQITDAEFKAIISLVFRDTVVSFMKETKLFRLDIPIDFYKGVQRYDILPPAGYYVEAVIGLRSGRAAVPGDYTLDERELVLRDCCPDYDLDKAVYAEAALVPLITENVCEFDAEFISRYYDAIRAGMEYRMYGMVTRTWASGVMMRTRELEYKTLRSKAIRGGTDSSKPVKIKYRRVSNVMC